MSFAFVHNIVWRCLLVLLNSWMCLFDIICTQSCTNIYSQPHRKGIHFWCRDNRQLRWAEDPSEHGSRHDLRVSQILLWHPQDWQRTNLLLPGNGFLVWPLNQHQLYISSIMADFWGLPDELNQWNSICTVWGSRTGQAQVWLNGKPSFRKSLFKGRPHHHARSRPGWAQRLVKHEGYPDWLTHRGTHVGLGDLTQWDQTVCGEQAHWVWECYQLASTGLYHILICDGGGPGYWNWLAVLNRIK